MNILNGLGEKIFPQKLPSAAEAKERSEIIRMERLVNSSFQSKELRHCTQEINTAIKLGKDHALCHNLTMFERSDLENIGYRISFVEVTEIRNSMQVLVNKQRVEWL